MCIYLLKKTLRRGAKCHTQTDRCRFTSLRISYSQCLVARDPQNTDSMVLRQAGLPTDRSNAYCLPSRSPSGFIDIHSRITVTRSCRNRTCFPFHQTQTFSDLSVSDTSRIFNRTLLIKRCYQFKHSTIFLLIRQLQLFIRAAVWLVDWLSGCSSIVV